MIIARESGTLEVVLQVDHQEQCGHAARAWGNEAFGRIARWPVLVRAAVVHDEGWRSWERAPGIRPDGRPIDLSDLDRATHVALYRDGIDAAVREDPLVGILVSMHGEGLYRSRLGLDGAPTPMAELPEPVRAFVCEQHDLQTRLRSRATDVPDLDAWLWTAYRLLQAWDSLCLFLAWRRAHAGSRQTALRRVPRALGDEPGVDLWVVALDARTSTCTPFPFAGSRVELPVAVRRIPDRIYRDDEDLQAELASAETETVTFSVVRGDR